MHIYTITLDRSKVLFRCAGFMSPIDRDSAVPVDLSQYIAENGTRFFGTKVLNKRVSVSMLVASTKSQSILATARS